MDRFGYLIVGAGFAGATCAEQLASAGQSVLVIDRRPHVAGNAYDETDEAGIRVSKYGAHIFHTNSREVFDYLSRFTTWRSYEHRVLSSHNGQLLPVPINRTTLAAFGGDLARAKATLYEPYTQKQWGPHAAELTAAVLGRVAPRDSDDDRYFLDTYQCQPTDGFTAVVSKMLDHPNIRVMLNTSYAEVARWSFTSTIWTGPIDEYFGYTFGRLPYRSASFSFATLASSWHQPVGVVNYPNPDYPYTRITEFKHLTGQVHPRTTIAVETPQATGEPYWPVPTRASAALYQEYAALAKQTPGVHFCGRLGTYRYLDIDQAVAQALKLARSLRHQEDACLHPH